MAVPPMAAYKITIQRMGQKAKNNKAVKETVRALANMQIVPKQDYAAAKKKAERQAAKRAVRKAMRKTAKAKGNQLIQHAGLSGVEGMDYLKCLLNPEQYQSSYPDKYNDRTAVATFIYNKNITWDPNGNFFVWVNPTMNDHVVQLTNGIPAGTYTFAGSFAGNKIAVSAGTAVNCGPLTSGDILAAAVGANYQAWDITANSAGDYVYPTLSANGSFWIEWTDVNVAYERSFDLGVTWASCTSAVAITATVGTAHIRFRAKPATGDTAVITSFVIRASLPLTGSAPTGAPVYTADDVDYYGVLAGQDLAGNPIADGPLYNEYRVVGMSALLTYEGDTLYNGGNITGRVVPGGETPFELGWTSYSAIAEFPQSYERPLTMGAYGFWLPTDDKDMQFRDMGVSNFRDADPELNGDLPSMVFAGTVKNTANAIVRLRVAMVVEAKVTPSFIPTEYSVVDTRQIEAVALALRGIPRIMENPLHLADIKNFLKKVYQTGKKYYDTGRTIYNAVEPFAAPLLTAAGAMLL